MEPGIFLIPSPAVLTLWLAILICLYVKRVLSHPLRTFPGPRLAALTSWYKGYYDVVKGGGLLDQLSHLHQRYGPVVRIGPNELHFSEPSAYLDIYAHGSSFIKDPALYRAFGQDEASFTYIDPHMARIRRSMLSPLFSRRAIRQLEHIIQAKVHRLVARLAAYQVHEPVDLTMAFKSTTLDIITSYCFADCFDALEADDFRHPILLAMHASLPGFWLLRHLPFLIPVFLNPPEWLPGQHAQAWLDFRLRISAQLDRFLADPALLASVAHEVIYHHLLNPHTKKLGPVPSRKSLQDEAQNLTIAGSDTVGNACAVGTFHVLNDRSVCRTLVKELRNAWPDKTTPMSSTELEKLPYLTAVIKESLRMSYGVVTPLPRVVGPSQVQIAGYSVTPGTTVSCGITFLHMNPEIFYNPRKFSPDRWLQPNAQELEKYFSPFSKGPRMCLGINLAWCELYQILGNIFRKLDMDLYDTTPDDFTFQEYFVPIYSGHLRVFVTETGN